jgi:hypothetical protein
MSCLPRNHPEEKEEEKKTPTLDELFQEALHHTRRPTLMRQFICSFNVESFAGQPFEEIFYEIWQQRPAGISKLGVYDIASKIFKYNGGNIPVIYLVGNGPIEAVKNLGLTSKIKKQKINDITLDYIEIDEVLPFVTERYTGSTTDGDDIESFLCVMHRL